MLGSLGLEQLEEKLPQDQADGDGRDIQGAREASGRGAGGGAEVTAISPDLTSKDESEPVR